ncbi:MAG: adenylosuccinate synthetase [Candidatus Lokiarchaeota archaeon]
MYKTIAIAGLSWGDEGKGKTTDFIAQNADIVTRFQGGANAGHTVVVNGKEKEIIKQELLKEVLVQLIQIRQQDGGYESLI